MQSQSRILRPFAEWVIRYRLSVIVTLLAVTVLLASRIGTLQYDSNPDLWAPQKHAYVLTTNLIEEVFGGRNITVIGITPKSGDIYQPEVLEKIQRIQRDVEQIPHAVRHNVWSLAARKVKSIEGTAEGMRVRQMMDPVPRTPEEIARLKAAVVAMPIYVNALVSPDHKSAAIVADFKQSANYIRMLQEMREIVERERDPSVEIYLGGTPVIGEAGEYHFQKMPLFLGVALLIIMAVQYWSFRSLQGMLLPMVTSILSLIWSLGLMGLLDVHLDPINTTTPILVLAVAAGHAVQILKRYYEEYDRQLLMGTRPHEANRAAVVESMVRVGPVMLTAGSIAAVSFFSLVGTGVPMVQHFGVFAGCGVLATMVLELTLVPALRSLLRPPHRQEAARERKTGILDNFLLAMANNLAGGRAPLIVIGGLLLLLAAGAGMTQLRVDNNFKLYHAPTSKVRTDDAVLNRTFGGTNSIQFLIQTPSADGIKDPAVLNGMAKLQSFLQSQEDAGKTQSLADLVKRMNQAMHSDDPGYHVIPDSRDLVAQYLLLYSLSGDPQDFDSFVDNDYRRASVWVYLKNDSTTDAESLAQKVLPLIPQFFPVEVKVEMGGGLAELIALNDVIVQDKMRNMAQMVLVVFVLGALAFRSVVAGAFVVTPLLAVIVANFGIMGWLGTPLDITAMTSAAMGIGIGADYEIYLLYRFREELARSGNVLTATRESMLTSGKAIMFVALSIIGGYSVLQASDFFFFSQISTMVMATMAVSVFFALFFLRALMMVVKPRFIFGKRSEVVYGPVAQAAGGDK